MGPEEHDPREDRELERMVAAYRELPKAEPSAALDAAVLAAARRALAVPVRRQPRWPALVATAATVTLAIGLGWQLRHADEMRAPSEATLPVPAAPAPAAAPAAIPAQERKVGADAEREADDGTVATPADATADADAGLRSQRAAEGTAQPAPVVVPAPAPAEPPILQEAAPARPEPPPVPAATAPAPAPALAAPPAAPPAPPAPRPRVAEKTVQAEAAQSSTELGKMATTTTPEPSEAPVAKDERRSGERRRELAEPAFAPDPAPVTERETVVRDLAVEEQVEALSEPSPAAAASAPAPATRADGAKQDDFKAKAEEPARETQDEDLRPDTPASTAATAGPALDRAPDAVRRDPERWLRRIRELQRMNRLDDARRELADFRRAHPSLAVPEDLRGLAR